MDRILIFDDNPDQLHLLKRNIEGEGREVIRARDLAQAEAYLAESAPDLVVADIRFDRGGEVDKEAGLKLLEKAKAQDGTIQVILVTNYASPEISRRAMELGAFDLLDRTPTGLDFWVMLRAKVGMALDYRKLSRDRKKTD